MSIFLEQSEIAMLTGRKFKSRQIDALRNMGIAFHINATGHPVVTRAAIEGKSNTATTVPKSVWIPKVLRAT